MPVRVSEKELDAVVRLPSDRKLVYAVRRAADLRKVWVLMRGGAMLEIEVGGQSVLPVWPNPEYALRNVSDGWADAEVVPIAWTLFVRDVLPQLMRRGVRLAVLYMGEIGGASLVESDEFVSLVALEMKRF